MGVTVGERNTVDSSVRLARPRRLSALTLLFGLTALVGAALLFVVQPMVARLVLPEYGGSATVWSTSSLFFQIVLLLGYLYVHAATTRMRRTSQPWLHLAVLLLPVMALPIALPADSAPTGADSPVIWLLRTLALTIGLPFAVISTTGPLLQRWYSWTVGSRAKDPYFLFAASNLGSFGGLLAYPLAIEPLLSLDEQRTAWSMGFGLFITLMAACGMIALRTRKGPAETPSQASAPNLAEQQDMRPSTRQYVVWFALAFLPSTLMLGVTAHISTDIAAIPLMWVVPLALYLATFVVAFARDSRRVNAQVVRAAVTLAAISSLAPYLRVDVPVLGLLLLDLVTLAIIAFAAHSRLSATRPAADHLTAFYLVVAAGGAAGGLLNGLIAPIAFDRVWEYPAALLGAMLLGVGVGANRWRALENRYGVRSAALLETLTLLLSGLALVLLGNLIAKTGQGWIVIPAILIAVGAWAASRRPVPLTAALGVLVLLLTIAVEGQDLENSRTFYGTYRIKNDNGARVLVHGTTVHGTQYTDARSSEPTAYFARSGPLGDVFDRLQAPKSVGVVGLGAGTIAAYGTPGQTMTFYEIDPEIVRIAKEQQHFTYLADSAADIRTVTGDGRLLLANAPDGTYDLLILDAFSSDSIPVHLLTQEAFDMYSKRLAPGGVLAVHISNRVFDLEPVVAASADRLGWSAAVGRGQRTENGATRSLWMVMSANGSSVDNVATGPAWRPPRPDRVEWTDNYSSVLGVLRGLNAD